jgi:uncharacterized protein
MKYRKMGKLDWEVSALGFGAMRLPTTRIIKRADYDESIRIIRRGIDLGINYIDTAYMYHLGSSEKIVGLALKDGYREKVKVATKLPTMMVRKSEDFEKFFNKQKEKLDLDMIDVYLFHHLNGSEFQKVKDLNLIPKMEKLKEEGLIKHIGFSFHGTLPEFKEIIDGYQWDIAQIQYNYMDAGIQATTEGLKYAHEKGTAVIIMEPIKGGFLANPPKEATAVMDKSSIKRTPVDWALQYLWNRPEVAVVLSGMGSMKMVEENCASAEISGVGSLNEQDNAILEELADIYRNKILVHCTSCKYCMPCPSGVNIPQNFALLNNAGWISKAGISNKVLQFMIKRRYKLLAKTKEQLQQKPNTGNASLCTQCGVCISKCPQNIQIPDELEKVNAILGEKKKISDYYSS